MKIRKATKKDINGIHETFQYMLESEDKASSKSANFLMKLRKRKNNFELNSNKDLEKEIKKKNVLWLVAVIDNKIVGYACGCIKNNKNPFFYSYNIGFLEGICVKKEYNGKGIAKELNKSMEIWFKKRKCIISYLYVLSENPAVEIYKKWDYKITDYKMFKELK